mmetsp:Transcript_3843/g.7608  ORF Transcript_3843/g.7608 Transcript_3843/m.7608 type:complete len:225 (-) Transcript_3843:672-1346(-)
MMASDPRLYGDILRNEAALTNDFPTEGTPYSWTKKSRILVMRRMITALICSSSSCGLELSSSPPSSFVNAEYRSAISANWNGVILPLTFACPNNNRSSSSIVINPLLSNVLSLMDMAVNSLPSATTFNFSFTALSADMAAEATSEAPRMSNAVRKCIADVSPKLVSFDFLSPSLSIFDESELESSNPSPPFVVSRNLPQSSNASRCLSLIRSSRRKNSTRPKHS